jgi:hypothetical protein
MKEIQPITLWVNGTQQTATFFNLQSINDNLLDSATFYWQLTNDLENLLGAGNLTMDAADYAIWSSTQDVNQSAYDWAASKLNITLV